MNVRDLLARARSQLGRGTRYQLGAGGYTPSKPYPGGGGGHAEDGCDCSGFVCWCLGISRHTTNEYYRLKLGTEWISTVSMFRDCGDSAGLFESLEHPRVGCIVVYPDGAAGKGRQGHVGIVTALRGATTSAPSSTAASAMRPAVMRSRRTSTGAGCGCSPVAASAGSWA